MSDHSVDGTETDAASGSNSEGSLSKAADGPPINWDDAGSVAAEARSDDPDSEGVGDAGDEGAGDDPLHDIYGPPSGEHKVGD